MQALQLEQGLRARAIPELRRVQDRCQQGDSRDRRARGRDVDRDSRIVVSGQVVARLHLPIRLGSITAAVQADGQDLKQAFHRHRSILWGIMKLPVVGRG